ncbi:MAG TPA: hypothetical protein P5318_03875 [Candidatus Hydrogenedentes bacterium]|nr:hypothetical protein [Candidatus Hydrogenedentota bacterium]HPC15287.1 hypothetical protein [Candidatus Hydrogenedentota bacterium]HRT19242.1 hypothetical protein [Candidatus Hydrogenedentota bacterium]HRT63322.1 hypothetical protein [Candidatus Hydrogenedentota bacterium]
MSPVAANDSGLCPSSTTVTPDGMLTDAKSNTHTPSVSRPFFVKAPPASVPEAVSVSVLMFRVVPVNGMRFPSVPSL